MLTVFAREQRVSEGAVMLSRDSARFSKFCLSFVFGRKMEVLLFNVFVVLYKKNRLMTGPSRNQLILFPSNVKVQARDETLRFSGNKIYCFPRDQSLSVKYLLQTR